MVYRTTPQAASATQLDEPQGPALREFILAADEVGLEYTIMEWNTGGTDLRKLRWHLRSCLRVADDFPCVEALYVTSQTFLVDTFQISTRVRRLVVTGAQNWERTQADGVSCWATRPNLMTDPLKIATYLRDVQELVDGFAEAAYAYRMLGGSL